MPPLQLNVLTFSILVRDVLAFCASDRVERLGVLRSCLDGTSRRLATFGASAEKFLLSRALLGIRGAMMHAGLCGPIAL